MRKIMFNDKYGLTEAVLSGRKTQTRRIVKLELYGLKTEAKRSPSDIRMIDGLWCYTIPEWNGAYNLVPKDDLPKYNIGDIVAIAQSYSDAGVDSIPEEDEEFGCYNFPTIQTPGWKNKMFVRADLMPHQIRITNVRAERLQNISDEDCIAEGIYKDANTSYFNGYAFDILNDHYGQILASTWYDSPRDAYAALIDKINGKGTWESNPFVYVYDFELIK